MLVVEAQRERQSLRKRANCADGMTIIEMTVMLSVLFILAGLLSPVVSESVTTARAIRAKNDANMITNGLINLQKDLGALSLGHTSAAAAIVATGEVMASRGDEPKVDGGDEALPAFEALQGPVALAARRSALRDLRLGWLSRTIDLLDDHLVANRRGYPMRRPGEYGGWNGPYLSASLNGDPWGTRYMINICWLDNGATATNDYGGTRRAVFVLSAGANGIVETPFEQPMTDARAYGDDIVVRIQ